MEVKQGPIFYGTSEQEPPFFSRGAKPGFFRVSGEIARDGLLYLLTHRSSHGTLMEAG